MQELFRKEAAYRKTLHGQLANQILAVGIMTSMPSTQGMLKILSSSSFDVMPRTLFLTVVFSNPADRNVHDHLHFFKSDKLNSAKFIPMLLYKLRYPFQGGL
ncbi:MAG: hypothetical protein PHI24_05270 [Desulfitobacteriaceae bacterium]|nr:hypothetical protein [Desulfitobacteriaceae bacterium]